MKSPALQARKRQRYPSYDEILPTPASAAEVNHSPMSAKDDLTGAQLLAGSAAPTGRAGHGAGAGSGSGGSSNSSSNFRNVSACNRCRLRKNRCDQKLPSCESCERARVACVGYDPITKTEIPRSYVYYLENRVEALESILRAGDIPFPPASNLELCSRPGVPNAAAAAADILAFAATNTTATTTNPQPSADSVTPGDPNTGRAHGLEYETHKRRRSSGPGAANPIGGGGGPSRGRSLAAASGVSFARVVLAAVQDSVSDQGSNSDPAGFTARLGTSMRDSFFGLHTKPTIVPARFPDRELGMHLVNIYFQHANPQIPILHRAEFMQTFDLAYSAKAQIRGARELYVLNMVFAIGSGSVTADSVKAEPRDEPMAMSLDSPVQAQPEEYHASAMLHFETCLSSNDRLGVLQAVLLLANFALLRPVPPGLWYIVGAAVRLAIDLGLYYEDIATKDKNSRDSQRNGNGVLSRGYRLYLRDKKRRLWWCTYSFDRLVGTCVGRPFSIDDLVITTEFPSLLDDDFITPTGLLDPGVPEPVSYKRVAYHYFRLRLLQSEILQVLQSTQAYLARARGQSVSTRDMDSSLLSSPFLTRFPSFRDWRIDIDRRLWEWKNSAPAKEDTAVCFSVEFLELNYWQAIIMLYRQSLSVPAMFEGEYNTSTEVNSPTGHLAELRGDEDRIYLKVAEAGQKIIRIYRQLHLAGLVSYTYLATHHLFMAGISYLYAIWHSSIVRSRLTMDEVDFAILAAKSIFSDMIDRCPPAETCRDAFDRTARATVKMAAASGGFGPHAVPRVYKPSQASRGKSGPEWSPSVERPAQTWSGNYGGPSHQKQQSSQQSIQFDLSLSDAAGTPLPNEFGQSSSAGCPMGGLKSGSNGSNGHPGLQQAGQQQRFLAGGSSPQDMMMPSPGPPLSSPLIENNSGYNMGQSQGAGSMSSTPNSGGNMLGQASATTPIDYGDMHVLDFLQGLEGTPSVEDSAMPSLTDVDFGFNWDGIPQFSDGQQVNLFDGFFFGGPGANCGPGADMGGAGTGAGTGPGAAAEAGAGPGAGPGAGAGTGAAAEMAGGNEQDAE